LSKKLPNAGEYLLSVLTHTIRPNHMNCSKAAGAPLTAIDAIVKGEIQNAFVCTASRHHAVAEASMGSASSINVAVGRTYAPGSVWS